VSGPSHIGLFLGRLHPMLVHLPIGLLLLVGLLEVLARFTKLKNANGSSGVILALAVPISIATAIFGLLLAEAGGYEPQLLQWHKWAGLATAALCLITATLYRAKFSKTYAWSLFATVAALTLAGHFGGSLTHGSDYLTRYAPGPVRGLLAWTLPHPKTKEAQASATQAAATKSTDLKDLPVFATLVEPNLKENCLSCHGPEKSKGGLRVDSFAALMKGSENGPVIIPGKSAESPLAKRLLLPPSDDDHMPPAGKPQPTADDLALLQWWIDSGASQDKKVGELKPPLKIERLLAARYGGPAPAMVAKTVPPKPLAEIAAVAKQLSDDLGLAMTPLSQSEPWLQCNAAVAGTNFGDAELARLTPLAANLRWLDLAGTKISDQGLATVGAMPNLKRLHLERTAITDAGLTNLAGLASLEYLNLYDTEVTDAGLGQLEKLPALKQVYLWQTKVTTNGVQTFTEARTDRTQLQRWQEEIEQLKTKIRDSQVSVDLGLPLVATPTNSAATTTNAAVVPINTICPVSGKPIDPAKTVTYEGRVIAFCCDDCKSQFEKDPKPFLSKLSSAPKKAKAKAEKKA